VNVAGFNLQLEQAVLPVPGRGAGDSGSRTLGAAGLNMFLATLSSAVENILSASQVEPYPTQSPLIQAPVTQLAINKEKTKVQEPALRNSEALQSSAGTTLSVLAAALPGAAQVQNGQSWLTPDSSGGQASLAQSGASASQASGDFSTLPCADMQNIAARTAGPVAFRLQLMANPELPVKGTSTLANQTSLPSNLSNQQTSAQSTDPSSGLSLMGNTQAASGSPVVAGPEKTPAGTICGDSSQTEPPPASFSPNEDLVPAPMAASALAVFPGPSMDEPALKAVGSKPGGPGSSTTGPSASSSSATVPSAAPTWSNASAPDTSAVAHSATLSTLAASAALSRPAQLSSGIWISPGAAHSSDSRALHVPDLTRPEIVFSPRQDYSTPESTATKPTTTSAISGTPAVSTEAEAGLAGPSGLAASPIAPLPESGTKLNESPAHEDEPAHEEGRPLSESQSKAAPAQNASQLSQSVPEPQDAEPLRKGDVAPNEVASQAAQRKPELDNEFRPSSDAAVQSIETITPPSAGDVRPDAVETPAELPRTTDLQPGIDSVTPTGTARQISLKLPGSGDANVAVQLTERAGRIEVAVRSGDAQLTKSLQSGLGDLVTRLENQGFKTQAWVPLAARQAATGISSWESGFSQQQQRERSNAWGGNQQRQGQGDSNQRRQPRPAVAFEENMADEDARIKQK